MNALDKESRIERLEAKFSDFPVREAQETVPPDVYERVKTFHESGVVGGARVLVRDGDRTLLLRDRHRPDEWALPGGAIEAGETAEAAGAREVLEETSIDCSISDVAFLVDETHVPADGSGDPIGGLVACFVADYEGGRIEIQESEVAEAKWWESLPDETGELVERAAARVE